MNVFCTCTQCGATFEREPDQKWKRLCLPCWIATKADKPTSAPAPPMPIDPDLRAVLIANKTLLIEHLSRPANEPPPRCRAWRIRFRDWLTESLCKFAERPRCRAWRIRFRDGSGATAVNTTGADHTEMLLIVREQFGAGRVASVEAQP